MQLQEPKEVLICDQHSRITAKRIQKRFSVQQKSFEMQIINKFLWKEAHA